MHTEDASQNGKDDFLGGRKGWQKKRGSGIRSDPCFVCRYSAKGVGFDIDTRAPLKPVRNCTFFAFCQYISSFYHERRTSNCQLFAFALWPCFVWAARTLLAFGALDLFYSCILHQTSDSNVYSSAASAEAYWFHYASHVPSMSARHAVESGRPFGMG
jgi:hypothetical protein